MKAHPPRPRFVRYEVPASREGWELSEEPVPESQPHDLVIDLLKAILLAWAAREGRALQVARNLAVRWDEARPRVGVDPDLCVLEPRTPEGDELTSLCTWRAGHAPPRLAVEVVSGGAPRKDYVSAPDKYAASGTEELWVFDPALVGPPAQGGPFRLQIWRRTDEDNFVRVYAGEGPARSGVLDAYALVVDEGRRLRVSSDPSGAQLWLTGEERERAEKERERAEKERERAEKERERADKERALARLAELEAALGKATTTER
ncbi:MAG: Uma2 family endonuclease [Polyangiaceae bacterium]|jgi:Uma2 family endonuclease|nr:Uma2 family endonuclease [Polyangiaceae bacterium]MBK8938624.1 Uma2 family endonuclease [Polyangiaceae bacterium]